MPQLPTLAADGSTSPYGLGKHVAVSISERRAHLRSAPARGPGEPPPGIPPPYGDPPPRTAPGGQRSWRSKGPSRELNELLTRGQHKDRVLAQIDQHIRTFDINSFKRKLAAQHPNATAAADVPVEKKPPLPESPPASPVGGRPQDTGAVAARMGADEDRGVEAVQQTLRQHRGVIRELCDQFPALRELVRTVTGEYERLMSRLFNLCAQRPDAKLQRAVTAAAREKVTLQRAHQEAVRRGQDAEARCRELENECETLRRQKRNLANQTAETQRLLGGLKDIFPDLSQGRDGGPARIASFTMRRGLSARGGGGAQMRQITGHPVVTLPEEEEDDGEEDDEEDEDLLPAAHVAAIIQRVAKEIEGLRADSERREVEASKGVAMGTNQYLDEIVELNQLLDEWRNKAEVAQAAAMQLSQQCAAMEGELQAATEVRAERDRLLQEAEVTRKDLSWLRLQCDMRQAVCDLFRKSQVPPAVCTKLADFGPVFAASWAARLGGRVKRDKFETWSRKCPAYLRCSTKLVRMRNMTQAETKVFIKDMFQTRAHIEQMPQYGHQTFDDYFSSYLHQKYNIQEMMMEHSYSVIDQAVKGAPRDFDFAIWLRMLERTLPETAWECAEEAVAAVRAHMPQPGKHKLGAPVPVGHVFRAITEAFPAKDQERISMLQCAAFATAAEGTGSADHVDREYLFSDGSRFVNELKRQLVHEQDELHWAVWRTLVALTPKRTEDADVPWTTAEEVLRRLLGESEAVAETIQHLKEEVQREQQQTQQKAAVFVRKTRLAGAGGGTKSALGQAVMAFGKRGPTSPTSPSRIPSCVTSEPADMACSARELVSVIRRTVILRPVKPVNIDWTALCDWQAPPLTAQPVATPNAGPARRQSAARRASNASRRQSGS
eukprot:TRINITY_DN31934_c0_g1_i1.p1 TRINITY_DN31934_c0_g1~~TRINITY_DN31934_c0_g1_i1.p1  ORF type:complete len:891 (+),score=300.51 TRINITY_DN31934_c0_g1_i1:66-2738(+)